MAKQQLHSGLAPIDVLTRTELEETLHKNMDAMLRQQYRGVDFIKIPVQFGAGNGSGIQLNVAGQSDPYCGPEQGDFWMLIRLNVVSSAFLTDTAKYVVFRGGTPSDTVDSTQMRYLLTTGVAGGQTQGIPYEPGQKKVYLEPGEQLYAQVFNTTIGNTYMMVGEAIRVPAEMKGKLL